MPWRRRTSPIVPSGQASASRKIASFCAAVNVRRFGRTSLEGASMAACSTEVTVVMSMSLFSMTVSSRPTLNYRRECPIPSWHRGLHYPRCVGGKRACPPEDCGGPYGYQSFLEIIADPEHHDYEQMIDWIGGTFDAEHFDPEEIIFHDPDERWKSVFKRH